MVFVRPTERALYSMECAFHPLFSLTSGACRLDYRRPENRCEHTSLLFFWVTGEPVGRCTSWGMGGPHGVPLVAQTGHRAAFKA